MGDYIQIENVKDFNPVHTFECGQCFRWNLEKDGSYTGVAYNKVINVKADKGNLLIRNSNEKDVETIWKSYFDLDRDYEHIKKVLSEKDQIMKVAIEFGEGIRLLNQDPWETIISFIISQNRNIPAIKKSIEEICQRYGQYIGNYHGKDYHGFPSPSRLKNLSIDDLCECGVGYRAKYIISVAKEFLETKNLLDIEALTDDELEKYLLSLHGVGPKVAHCIMLFGMKRYQQFPMDIWIERSMEVLYGLKGRKQVKSFVDQQFMGYGGFAQQYLFYYTREKKIGKKQI